MDFTPEQLEFIKLNYLPIHEAQVAAEKAAADALAIRQQTERVQAELDAAKNLAGRYEQTILGVIESRIADIPAFIKPLLDKMPLDERLSYISQNESSWATATVNPSPTPTPSLNVGDDTVLQFLSNYAVSAAGA